MIIREGIEVTRVTLDGYELPISEGFSEFLLCTGYWRVDEEFLAQYEKNCFGRW